MAHPQDRKGVAAEHKLSCGAVDTKRDRHPARRNMPLNNHLREQWVKRGYCAHAASAAVVPPPPVEFRRAYHPTSADHAVSDIAFSRIKIARFRELNDPFELLSLTVRNPDQLARLQKHNADVDGKTSAHSITVDPFNGDVFVPLAGNLSLNPARRVWAASQYSAPPQCPAPSSPLACQA